MTDEPVAIACTLGADDASTRVAEWRAVLERAASRDAVEGGLRLRFDHAPALAATLADLAQREQGCCSFFDFEVGIHRDHLSLVVRAPSEAAGIVESLFG